jgi:hypothetical protein
MKEGVGQLEWLTKEGGQKQGTQRTPGTAASKQAALVDVMQR